MFVPVLCLILFGIVQFGTMIGTHMDLTSATRDAARRAVDARTESNPDQVVEDAFLASLDTTNETDVTVNVSGTWARDEQITVTSTLPYDLDIMGLVVWQGNLTAQSVVRIG
jgi:Flp pilus assembly protein TadG